jgi:iron complex transport system ATP-binding protein
VRRAVPFLQFKSLTVHRGLHPALSDVSLELRSGESVAVIGPNGSGKSTLVKAVTRECYPWDGEAKVFGKDRWDVFALRHQLGIVTQDVQRAAETNVAGRDIPGLEVVLSGFFSSVGVWDVAEVTPEMTRKARRALAFLGVSHLAERPLTEMSSGEARRVLIARALAHEPQALILDEPTNSLDIAALQVFLKWMRKIVRSGTDLVLVTHHLHDVVPEIRRVILLKDGRLFADGEKSKILTSENLSAVFGIPIQVSVSKGWYAASSKASGASFGTDPG